MKSHTIRILVIIGAIAVIALAVVQFYLLQTAYRNNQSTFENSVQVALYQVARRINNYQVEQLPQQSPIIKESSSTYIVDVNKEVDCEIIEFFLKSEFEKANIRYDFEFAVYDCYSDALIYGNYITYSAEKADAPNMSAFNKSDDLVYYFIVHFPKLKTDLFGALRLWGVFTAIFCIVLLFTVYAIWVVLSQKRYSELQKTFVSTMTHEFRTPISASNVAIEYLQKSKTIIAEERLKKYVNLIDLQNKRLNELIERLLYMSKSEKKSVQLIQTRFDFYDLFQSVLDGMQKASPNASFENKIMKRKIWVKADLFHSRNILHALLDNAVKYAQPAPSIVLEAKELNHHLYLDIYDNGIGIPARYRRKIFTQFFRVPTGNVHNVKGFGIGLYYVKLLCKRMRWKIRIASSNQGTKVMLKIPVSTN